jgi:hypothetical protein
MPKGFMRTALALIAATVGGAAMADDAKLVKRSYPVGEFVVSYQQPGMVPPKPVAVIHMAQLGTPLLPPPAVHPALSKTRDNAESLSRLMVNMVKPHSWQGMGGAGSVAFDEASCSLVVNQTADVHAHVADLIASMRRVHSASMPLVQLELTSVEVPYSFFESAGIDAEVKTVAGTSVPTPACPDCERCPVLEAVNTIDGKKPATVTLSADQVQCLMKCVQADRTTNVLARPKMIVADMQTGHLQVGQQVRLLTGLELIAGPNGVERRPQYRTVQLGTTISATPAVSADRQSVQLRLLYKTARPAAQAAATAVKVGEEATAAMLTAPVIDAQAIETTLAIPAGKTVLLAGPIEMRERDLDAPVVSGVQHAGKLFVQVNKGVAREKCRHLLLVTAKVMTPNGGDCCTASACKVASPAADCKACPTTSEAVAVAKPARPADTEVSRLVAAYHKACADGRTEDAIRLAMQALSRDPNCFAGEK